MPLRSPRVLISKIRQSRSELPLPDLLPMRSACARRLRARLRGLPAPARRTQLHPRAPRFRESNGDSLLWRACAVLAFPNVLHFFADEFAGLSAGRLSFTRIFAGAFNRFLIWHRFPPYTDNTIPSTTRTTRPGCTISCRALRFKCSMNRSWCEVAMRRRARARRKNRRAERARFVSDLKGLQRML